MKRSLYFIPLTVCIVTSLLWCIVLTLKFYSFGYSDWDLAFFTQAAWNLIHGQSFVSLVGINYFGDHSYFFTFLTLPFFYLAPSPLTLIYLKVIAFTFSGFLLYRIANEELGERPALYILVLYLFFPGNIFGLLYEFNPEAFAPPLILLAWQSARKGEFTKFLIYTILLSSIKENMFLIAIMLCFMGFSKSPPEGRARWLILSAIYSGIFFYLIFKLIPSLRNLPQHAFMTRYLYLGDQPSDLLLAPFLHCKKFIRTIFHQINLDYICGLFNYLLIPALFSISKLLPAAPIILQHLLSHHMPEHTIFYHYVPTISPFIFIAFITTLKKLNRSKPHWLTIILVGCSILAILSLISYTKQLRMRVALSSNTEVTRQRWQLLNKIPNDDAVVTTFNYLAPLSTRDGLYSFHKVYDNSFQNPTAMKKSELNTEAAFKLPDDVRYALIDLDDDWLVITISQKDINEQQRIEKFLNDPQWELIGQANKTILLFRSPSQNRQE